MKAKRKGGWADGSVVTVLAVQAWRLTSDVKTKVGSGTQMHTGAGEVETGECLLATQSRQNGSVQWKAWLKN